MNTTKNESQKTKENKQESIVKITITKEAGDYLNKFIDLVNEGFDAGKVNRQDIASWIIAHANKSFGDNEIQLIRKEFFKERTLLEAIIKKAKTTGDMPDSIREALYRHWAGDATVKRSNRKLATEGF